MAKLTEKDIADLTCPAARKDRLVFDDLVPGLAVRVSGAGAKSFLAQYATPTGKRRIPLGRWGAVTLDQARKAAKARLGEVALGRDPAKELADVRTAAKAAKAAAGFTLEALLQEWDRLALANLRERYRREALRALRYAFAGQLGQPAAGLTREAVLAVLDQQAQTGKGVMAGRTRAYGHACFAWGQKRGKVPTNPFIGLPIASRAEARDRVLTMEEVGAIWHVAGELGWPFGSLIRLLLLTGQRREEVTGMRWSEITGTIWTIPKERAKNGRAHVVHLAPAAQAILADLPRNGDLVFTTNGSRPVSGFTKAKARLDERMAQMLDQPLQPWRLHDFRRTMVTVLAGSGVPPHVCDRLLNHVTGAIQGVAAVYQRAEFLAERKAALEVWGEMAAE